MSLLNGIAPNEVIYAKTKRSFFALVSHLILVIVLIALLIPICYGIDVGINAIQESFGGQSGFDALCMALDITKIVLIIIDVGGCVLSFIFLIIDLKCNYLVLTNKRIYGRSGVIARKTFDVLLDKVDTVRTSESFFGRILKYSTLEIISPSSSTIVNGNTVNPKFEYISNAEDFRVKVLNAIEQMKAEEKAAQINQIKNSLQQQMWGNR